MGSFSGASAEQLESRVLMAVDIMLSQRGRLFISSPATDVGADLVEVTLINGRRNLQVWVNGEIRDPTPRGGSSTFVRRSRVRRIVADLGAGDDRLFIGRRETEPRVFRNKLFVRCTLSGGDGNDIIEGGPLDDLLIGGAGDDILFGGRGNDLVFGGSGNDQIFGETGRDNLFGQDGDDYLHGDGNEDALYGMAGADRLIGGEDEDFVHAAPGPGDIQDRNEKPNGGETERVTEYVDKLIQLGVPERFRDDARS